MRPLRLALEGPPLIMLGAEGRIQDLDLTRDFVQYLQERSLGQDAHAVQARQILKRDPYRMEASLP